MKKADGTKKEKNYTTAYNCNKTAFSVTMKEKGSDGRYHGITFSLPHTVLELDRDGNLVRVRKTSRGMIKEALEEFKKFYPDL